MAKKCPLFKKPCLQHECEWYMNVSGHNPQSGDPVDQWGCSINYAVLVGLEANKDARAHRDTVQGLRSDIEKRGQVHDQVYGALLRFVPRLLSGNSDGSGRERIERQQRE